MSEQTSTLYRRNTHDRVTGEFRGRDAFGAISDKADGYYHWLECERAMTFDEFCSAIEHDETNFYDPATYDPESGDCRIPCPSREELRANLDAMLTAGLAEVVPADWKGRT